MPAPPAPQGAVPRAASAEQRCGARRAGARGHAHSPRTSLGASPPPPPGEGGGEKEEGGESRAPQLAAAPPSPLPGPCGLRSAGSARREAAAGARPAAGPAPAGELGAVREVAASACVNVCVCACMCVYVCVCVYAGRCAGLRGRGARLVAAGLGWWLRGSGRTADCPGPAALPHLPSPGGHLVLGSVRRRPQVQRGAGCGRSAVRAALRLGGLGLLPAGPELRFHSHPVTW